MFPYNVSAYIIIIETLKFVNALSKIFSFFFTNRQKNLRLFLSSGFSFSYRMVQIDDLLRSNGIGWLRKA